MAQIRYNKYIKPLYFATSNKGKAKEAEQILQFPIEIKELELDEIQELDLGKIVDHKVRQAYDIVKEPVFVDDVALYVDVWKSFPGPFVKHLREVGGNDLLLYMMRNETNRKVTAIATIGFHDGEYVRIFSGSVVGEITKEPMGNNSWGWDPIFKPVDSDMTFAEMSEEMKNKMSHRFKALEKFKEYLRSTGAYTA